MTTPDTAAPGAAPTDQPVFHIEKLYLKDFSFENPNAPEIYQDPNEPKVTFNLDTKTKPVGQDHFEVTLNITVDVKAEEKALFLVEVSYAGLFLMRNIPKDHMAPMLGIECPNILFPYIRQVVTQVVTEGGFKPLVLDPINFAAVYQQAQQQRQQQQAAG
ncbi:MAG: protein-export chaperone SecB, partial [Magnetococcales bacterium]|nr:protein-export chaperone SecB [Magnetococcales bacterium]